MGEIAVRSNDYQNTSGIEMASYDLYHKDRIEFDGAALINAQREGRCGWCGIETVWYDMMLREYSCSEECTHGRYLELSEETAD